MHESIGILSCGCEYFCSCRGHEYLFEYVASQEEEEYDDADDYDNNVHFMPYVSSCCIMQEQWNNDPNTIPFYSTNLSKQKLMHKNWASNLSTITVWDIDSSVTGFIPTHVRISHFPLDVTGS